jgi:hypothetical protein
VNAPVSEVYHRCLRFEDFPAFINSISKIDNTHFSCTWSINGEEVQSHVQIIMRVPDRRIAWQAASDHFRVGVVFFVPIGRAWHESDRQGAFNRRIGAAYWSASPLPQELQSLRRKRCRGEICFCYVAFALVNANTRYHAALCWPCSSLLLYAFLPLVESLPNGGAQVTSHRLARNLGPVQ